VLNQEEDSGLTELKEDIAQEFGENDGEVGRPQEFDLIVDGKLLSEDNFEKDHLITNILSISKKKYLSFAEHLISPYSTKMRWIFRVLFVITASLFIAACAQISFTLPIDRTVPVTFQTLAVLLVGSLQGPYLGTAGTLLYIFFGSSGTTLLCFPNWRLCSSKGTHFRLPIWIFNCHCHHWSVIRTRIRSSLYFGMEKFPYWDVDWRYFSLYCGSTCTFHICRLE